MRAGAKNKKASKGPSWNGLFAIPKDVISSELRPICSWSTSCSWLWVARLRELQRVLCQEPTKDHVKKSTAFKLKCSVWWASLRCVITTIRSAKVELERAENKIRRLELTCWKNRFCAEVKYAGRWLQERDACAEVNIRTCRPTRTRSMQIYDSWWLEVSKYLEGQGGLPDMILYGKGSDAQVAAATILQHFQQHGFMCSLD